MTRKAKPTPTTRPAPDHWPDGLAQLPPDAPLCIPELQELAHHCRSLALAIAERLPVADAPWRSRPAYQMDPKDTLSGILELTDQIDGILDPETLRGVYPGACDAASTPRRHGLHAAVRTLLAAWQRLHQHYAWEDCHGKARKVKARMDDGPPAVPLDMLSDLVRAADGLDGAVRQFDESPLARAIGDGAGLTLSPLNETVPVAPQKGERPRKRRRASSPRVAPLTPKQTEAMQLVAEHKGNISAAARAAGKSPPAMKKLYNKALAKLGRSAAAAKPKTQRLPTDRRGQEVVFQEEE